MTGPERQLASLPHPLARVRRLHGWSYQGLVDAIARQAARMPQIGNMASRREKAWRWEHWKVVPDRDTQRALAALLSVPAERLEQLPWPHWLPVGDDPSPELEDAGRGRSAGRQEGQDAVRDRARNLLPAGRGGHPAGVAGVKHVAAL
jgi:hypothetical protein